MRAAPFSGSTCQLCLAALLLVLPPSVARSQPADLLAAEDVLAEARCSEAARALAAIAADTTRPAAERARAYRGQAAAHVLRLELQEAFRALARAVSTDPRFTGNPYLPEKMAECIEGDGGADMADMDDLLAELDQAAAEASALRAGVIRLHALVHRMNGRFAEARQRTAELGRVTDFVILGPFDNVGGAGIEEAFPPEAGVDLNAAVRDRRGRLARWMRLPTARGEVLIDAYFDNEPDAVAYAATAIRPPAAGPAHICLSGIGAFRLWLNGRLVLDEHEARSGPWDLAEIAVDLEPGWNQLLVKAAAELEDLSFSVRCTDADGNPLPVECSTQSPALASVPVLAASPDAPIPQGLERYPAGGWLRRWSGEMAGAPLADQALFINALLDRGLHDEAESAINAAVSRFPPMGAGAPPGSGPALIESLRALLLSSRGDENQSAELNRRIARSSPEALSAQMNLILELLEEGEDLEAQKVLETAAVTFSRSPMLLALKGGLAIDRGHVREGRAEIAQALTYAPGHLIARKIQLVSLEERENAAAYEASRLDALRARPDHIPFALEAADIARRKGDADTAIGYLRHALEAGMRPDKVHEEIASILREAGRPAEAVAALEEGRRWSPLDAGMTGELAALMLEQGRKEDAKRYLERQIELDAAAFDARAKLRELNGQRPLREFFPTDDAKELARSDLSWADPDAGAIMLLEAAHIVLYPDGASEYRHHCVFKVRNEAGVDAVRKFDVPSLLVDGEVEIARTIKADGRVIEADRGFGEIAFGELAPGDVAEVRYAVRKGIAPGLSEHFWHSHVFQAGLPCLKNRLALLAPAGIEFEFRAHNTPIKPKQSKLGEWQLTVWEAQKLPARSKEPNLPPSKEYSAWIDISTISSWNSIARWYDGISRERIRPSAKVKAMARSIADSARAGGEQSAQVIPDSVLVGTVARFVERAIRYEGGQFIDSGYIPRSADRVLRDRYGDCKDQAVLIVSLLRELGIRADIALVNSSDVMTVPYLPSPRFTHALARAETGDGRVYWLDPTAKNLPFPNVPIELEGIPALVIGRGDAVFETIAPDPPPWNGHESATEAAVDAGGALSLSGSTRFAGEDATAFRKGMQISREIREKGLEMLLTRIYRGARVEKSSLAEDEVSGEMVMTYTIASPTYASFAANLMMLPVPWMLADTPLDLLALENREHALVIDTWKGCYRQQVRMALPDGCSVFAIPPAVETRCALGSFSFKATQIEPEVYLFERFFQIDVSRVEPAEYAEFRDFVLKVSKADQEQVVVRVEGK